VTGDLGESAPPARGQQNADDGPLGQRRVGETAAFLPEAQLVERSLVNLHEPAPRQFGAGGGNRRLILAELAGQLQNRGRLVRLGQTKQHVILVLRQFHASSLKLRIMKHVVHSASRLKRENLSLGSKPKRASRWGLIDLGPASV
jgi:hypothetical protein